MLVVFGKLRRVLYETTKISLSKGAQELLDNIMTVGSGSDVVGLVMYDHPDAPAALAGEFDMDTVKSEWVDEVRDEIIKMSQEALKRKGISDPFRVYRGGAPRGDAVPVSLSKNTAEHHACYKGRDGTVYSWMINHDDVLVYVDLFQMFYDEKELLIKSSAIKPDSAEVYKIVCKR